MSRPLFLAGALALLLGWLPLIAVCVRRSPIDGLVALELAGALTTLLLVCLAVGLQQSAFGSLALISAVATIVSGLIFARFLGRNP